MHTDYLGDALDFWKGSLLERLGYGRVGTKRISVVPMFTKKLPDVGQMALYADLLGRRPEDIVLGDRLFSNAVREEYFAQASRITGDLFLDPDTGVGHHSAQHVTDDDLALLVQRDRLLMVYQHSWRGTSGLLARLGGAARTAKASGGYLSCGQAGIFYLSRTQGRAAAVTTHLASWLGDAAPKRLNTLP